MGPVESAPPTVNQRLLDWGQAVTRAERPEALLLSINTDLAGFCLSGVRDTNI